MKKKWILASFAVLAMSSHASDDAVIAKYNTSCAVCHVAGVAGAPVTGDAEAWAPRLDKGMNTLVASVKNGLNAMPPGGMCHTCSDDDLRALIEHMSVAQ